jgi:signal transduction histidine kinase
LRIIFACALLVAAGGAILRLPLTGLSQDQQFTLLVLAATTLAADVFSLDFPDRKRISGGYIFPLLASALVVPGAGPAVAGIAGIAVSLLRGDRRRSVLIHGPRLIVAAALAVEADLLLFGRVPASADVVGALGILLYAAIYTSTAWGLGWLEERLAGAEAPYPSVDLLTNLLLVPLPMALGLIDARTGAAGLRLSALGLTMLLIIVRSYVNLATLHRQLRDAYERLAQQERQLEQSLDTNREMSQIVSHDLRGPLTSVMGYAELLRATLTKPEVDVPKAQNYLDSVERNSRRIMSLADKLLDLHRLELGGPVEMGLVDVEGVLRQLAEELELRAEQKRVAMHLELPAGLPQMHSSEWMVREIAENLLSNAIKYTPEGGHVSARAAAVQDALRFEVEDDGLGMAPEDRAKLFTKFFRSGARAVRQEQGTGLGLALTKNMIDKLGGRVEVWTELGRGSRFTVWLPLVAAGAPPRE